jgi:hypothetical protein
MDRAGFSDAPASRTPAGVIEIADVPIVLSGPAAMHMGVASKALGRDL